MLKLTSFKICFQYYKYFKISQSIAKLIRNIFKRHESNLVEGVSLDKTNVVIQNNTIKKKLNTLKLLHCTKTNRNYVDNRGLKCLSALIQ